MKTEAIFAVVAGIDLNGLGVLRSLGAERVPLVALDTDLSKPTLATRFGRKVRVDALSGPQFVEALVALRDQFDRNPVLILTQEASVATVSEERERLSEIYRFTLPAPEIVRDLQDKMRFQTLAEQIGSPVPHAASIDKTSGVAPARSLRYPCVIKPKTKDARYGARFGKACKVASPEELESLWPSMRELASDFIVQEWIEGKDHDIYFCLQYRPRNGTNTSFVGQKMYQWPPLVGGTASCIPGPEVADELTRLTNHFFDRAGFSGIGSMEYKRDSRDGRFYLVEPTVGRTDYQEEVATLNGVNIPYAAYLGETGQSAPAARFIPRPMAWRDPIGYARARELESPESVTESLPRLRVCDAYFRIDDPRPYLALKLQAVKRRLSQ
jgi:D-aspartate ligase